MTLNKSKQEFSFVWSLDSINAKGSVIHGHGWFFDTQRATRFVTLTLMDGAGRILGSIPAECCKLRPDVYADYPDCVNASASGFLFFGSFGPHNIAEAFLSIEIELVDGEKLSIEIPKERINESVTGATHIFSRGGLLNFGLLKKAFSMLPYYGPKKLAKKIVRYTKARLMVNTGLMSAETLIKKLSDFNQKKLTLIVDHSLGGGANAYRSKLVQSLVDEGGVAVVLSYNILSLSYYLMVSSKEFNQSCEVSNLEIINSFSIKFNEIVYNTAVSLPYPEELVTRLITLKESTNAFLRVLLHDFYTVCPSHFLLDFQGNFCNIPERKKCDECLYRNANGFTSLTSSSEITEWRMLWGGLFKRSDEIVAFSHSTLSLVRKAYPDLALERLRVLPHQVEHIKRVPEINLGGKLCIGVIGQINFHKGANVVVQLAEELVYRGLDATLTVIGEIGSFNNKGLIVETGSYKREELPDLIEQHKINMVLFPSICPETFSYVVAEVMEMQLPLAVFDLGAPAERVASYSKGRILKSKDATQILDDLINFHAKVI